MNNMEELFRQAKELQADLKEYTPFAKGDDVLVGTLIEIVEKWVNGERCQHTCENELTKKESKMSESTPFLLGKSKDKEVEMYQVGNNVYRVGRGWLPDIDGKPQGMRWECTTDHWNRFRSIYSWIEEEGEKQ